jgi:4-amino-4-deoxy-L-arabinose transferase-like glycosyltransferase
MHWNELTSSQGACLLLATALGSGSIWAMTRSHHRLAIGLLTLAALLLRLFAATLDPFLNDWDEVYHAVVARNMVEHPLRPMLFKEAALPTTTSWAEQHIWLHKPPFFLWQMALSINAIGEIPLAVRLPSALWTTLMVPAVWRMGAMLRNERTGFVAASMVAFSFLLQELVAGSINTDHNDAVFIGLITCTTWAWLEHVRKPSFTLAAGIGLLTAFAILTKWYIGSLVLLPYGLYVVFSRSGTTAIKHFAITLLVAALPVGAWLWHITTSFPVESSYEAHENWLRWSTPLEGHRGDPLFHLHAIADLVPPLNWWLVFAALGWLIWRVSSAAHRILLVSTVGAVHVFFLLAQTKMVCYTMVLLPLYCVALSSAVVDLCERISPAWAAKGALAAGTIMLCCFTLDLPRILSRHSLQSSEQADPRWRKQNLAVMDQMPQLARYLGQHPKPILFNVPLNHNSRTMFALGIDAWSKPPKPEDVERLSKLGYTVLVLQDGAAPGDLPGGVRIVPDSVFSITRDVRI